MMSEWSDTSPEAARVLADSCRNMTMLQKWRQMGSLYRTARALHAAGVRHRNPGATEAEIRESWMRQMLGDALAREIMEVSHGNARR